MPSKKPAAAPVFEYKIIGGKWHEMEVAVSEAMNEGWTLQGGCSFVEYHKGTNQAYASQAMFRKVTHPQDKAGEL